MRRNKYGTTQCGFYSHFRGDNYTVKKDDDTNGIKLLMFFSSQDNLNPELFHTLNCEICSPQLFEFFCLVYVSFPSGLFMNSCGIVILHKGPMT